MKTGNFVARDKSFFKKIFDFYYLPVKSYAFRYVAHDGVAEDLTQDVFLKLWERRGDFNSPLAARSFLYTSVRNASLDHLKHQEVKRRNESQLRSRYTEKEDEGFILEEEVHTLIYNAIEALSQQARRVVILTMEGASNTEIAEKLNISVNTVKTVKLRAYKTLRVQLKGIQWVLPLLLGI